MENTNTDINTSNAHLVDEMIQWRESVLAESGKNMFFKNSQKKELAKSVCEQFDLQQLFAMSAYRVQNTNRIYLNYSIFKLYANPAIYELIISHMLTLYDTCIYDHGSYFLYINLDGFTISAADRYKDFIMQYSNMSSNYTRFLEKMQILNTPTSFEAIIKMLKPFIAKDVGVRMETMTKSESMAILETL